MATHSYPTIEHERAADAITSFFAARSESESVLLVNSCARGKATVDSCLDIVVLARPGFDASAMTVAWERFATEESVFTALRHAGRFSVVHLDIEQPVFDPPSHPADEYPDDFEIVIGNYVRYSVPLWDRDGHFAQLRDAWLPYYDDDLRLRRYAEVRECCRDTLAHIPPYVERGLYFQSFARLWGAFRMFLQALFIARRTYPIAYDKWIHEQIVEILGLPDLYPHLPGLFEISRFESVELVEKAERLQVLLDRYVEPAA